MMGRVNQIAQQLGIPQLAFSAGVCVISSENYCTGGHETGGISLNLLFRWFRGVNPNIKLVECIMGFAHHWNRKLE